MTRKAKNKILEGFHTLVAGITRHGKSYFVKKILIPILVQFKPVIVFDRKQEYAGKMAVDHDSNWRGYFGIQDFFNRFSVDDETLTLSRNVHVVNCQNDQDYISGLRFFERLKQPVSLVLDEAHDIFLDKDFYDAKSALVKVVRYGASFGIDVILITQRTMDIPPDIRSQFLSAISFRQNHEDDVKCLDKKGWPDADAIMNLEKQQYKVFGDLPDHVSSKLSTVTK